MISNLCIEIENFLKKDEALLYKVYSTIPNVKEKLINKSLTFEEINEISSIKSQLSATSCLSNNLTIAIRLLGGATSTSNLLGITASDLSEMSSSLDLPTLEKLSNKLDATHKLEPYFFDKTRVFYTDRQIVKFRHRNLTRFIAMVNNFKEFNYILMGVENHTSKKWHKLINAYDFAEANQYIRNIEDAFKLKRGFFDRHEDKFIL